jgi:DNA-binding transcriptional LysR family regulator
MELRHFRYVIAVAEELNFGRAAERLNICQPPLSHQIRLLEEELGVKLFERTKRRVEVTEAGRRLVDEARKVLAQVEQAAKVASRTSKGELGHLSLGMIWEQKLLVEALRVFAKRYPEVHVDLHRLSAPEQAQAIAEGRLHVGFMIASAIRNPSLVYETLGWDPLVVGLPERHHLAALERVPLRALADERYIMFQRDINPNIYDDIIAVCRNAGFSLNIFHQVNNIYSSMALVAAGLGVALFPGAVRDVGRRGVVYRQLQGRMPKMESILAYKAGTPVGATRAFLDTVRTISSRKFSLKDSR